MKTVALTGGIGSGKSTVARALSDLDVPCFISDIAGATLYADPSFCQQVVERLGKTILCDGEIDKHAVADIIFSNDEKRQKMNQLVHPRVWQMFERWRSMWVEEPYVVFESALIYEEQWENRFDAVVVVYCSLEERLQRLQLRNHTTVDRLLPMVSSQMSDEEKLRRADYVILNYEGNPRQRQVEHLHHQLCNL